ncbi:MAG: D-aminoacyl-tRNA deacylase [Saprospiraceae bacterium]
MKVVIQRVSQANVISDGLMVCKINIGLLLLLGIEHDDQEEDADWLGDKIIKMRIFSDADGKMNLSVTDVNGEIMVVSQFTLQASTKKGNRPSFIKAARPDQANRLYWYFKNRLQSITGKEIASGLFGEDMKVNLINDGPVTIIIDTKNKE